MPCQRAEKIEEGLSRQREFLEEFYRSPRIQKKSLGDWAADAPGMGAIRRLFRQKGKKQEEEAARDAGEFREEISEEDVFWVDTQEYQTREKKELTKRTRASLILLLVVIPLTLAIGFFFLNGEETAVGTFLERVFGSRKYYFVSLFLVIYALIPFTMVFEGRKPQARELIVLAALAALATAGRAAFFMVPSFKPVVAVVIISGIAFGGEAGFLVGAVTMLASNFLFGQGPWTPWQMFACGFIGFLSGILSQLGVLSTKKMPLCAYGFLVTLFLYGGIMNPAALFMSVYEFTWEGLLAVYISGLPVDLVHASSTFIFLFFGAEPLLEKLQRIKKKYGLL